MNNILNGFNKQVESSHRSCCVCKLKYILSKAMLVPNHERMYHSIHPVQCARLYYRHCERPMKMSKVMYCFRAFRRTPKILSDSKNDTHRRTTSERHIHRVRKVLSHRTRHGYYTLTHT